MLIGLKVSSTTSKCVFYPAELNAKKETHPVDF